MLYSHIIPHDELQILFQETKQKTLLIQLETDSFVKSHPETMSKNHLEMIFPLRGDH